VGVEALHLVFGGRDFTEPVSRIALEPEVSRVVSDEHDSTVATAACRLDAMGF
jgi:hypothetical protein